MTTRQLNRANAISQEMAQIQYELTRWEPSPRPKWAEAMSYVPVGEPPWDYIPLDALTNFFAACKAPLLQKIKALEKEFAAL